MDFEKPTLQGRMLKRYKRFFMDLELDSGECITAHIANTGSMKTCWIEGERALVTVHDNPKRKLPYSVELTQVDGHWIVVNTARANPLVENALNNNLIKEVTPLEEVKREVKWGDSRLDFMAKTAEGELYLEVKSVTFKGENERAEFPDSVSTRGQKHLRELMDIHEKGHRAVMLFVVQRQDVKAFAPAKDIDPEYSRLLKLAQSKGVEVLCYQTIPSLTGIEWGAALPIEL